MAEPIEPTDEEMERRREEELERFHKEVERIEEEYPEMPTVPSAFTERLKPHCARIYEMMNDLTNVVDTISHLASKGDKTGVRVALAASRYLREIELNRGYFQGLIGRSKVEEIQGFLSGSEEFLESAAEKIGGVEELVAREMLESARDGFEAASDRLFTATATTLLACECPEWVKKE